MATLLDQLKKIPAIVLAAIIDLLVRVLYIVCYLDTATGINKALFGLILCAPSLFVLYAVAKDKFGFAYLWPLCHALLWALAFYVTLVLLLTGFLNIRSRPLPIYAVGNIGFFYLIYALLIARHMKLFETAPIAVDRSKSKSAEMLAQKDHKEQSTSLNLVDELSPQKQLNQVPPPMATNSAGKQGKEKPILPSHPPQKPEPPKPPARSVVYNKGIVHGDITAHNIVRDKSGNYKLIGFSVDANAEDVANVEERKAVHSFSNDLATRFLNKTYRHECLQVNGDSLGCIFLSIDYYFLFPYNLTLQYSWQDHLKTSDDLRRLGGLVQHCKEAEQQHGRTDFNPYLDRVIDALEQGNWTAVNREFEKFEEEERRRQRGQDLDRDRDEEYERRKQRGQNQDRDRDEEYERRKQRGQDLERDRDQQRRQGHSQQQQHEHEHQGGRAHRQGRQQGQGDRWGFITGYDCVPSSTQGCSGQENDC